MNAILTHPFYLSSLVHILWLGQCRDRGAICHNSLLHDLFDSSNGSSLRGD